MSAENTTETISTSFSDFDSKSFEDKAFALIADYRDVQGSVESASQSIAHAAQLMAEVYVSGGNIFFVGAGTSGRLGVLQHAECPPTFNTAPERIQYMIAGGTDAVFLSGENAEDSREDGYSEAKQRVTAKDLMVGMSASGTTQYVLGALQWAAEQGCPTIAVVCNTGTPIAAACDVAIELVTGAEYPHGGTRKKAAQAQKMCADVLTTLMNYEIGNIYDGEMVNMRAWLCAKLRKRAVRIVRRLCDVDEAAAQAALEASEYHLKPTIVMLKKQISLTEAQALLDANSGNIHVVLNSKA